MHEPVSLTSWVFRFLSCNHRDCDLASHVVLMGMPISGLLVYTLLSILLGTGRWVKVKICRNKLSHGISVIQSLECSWLTCRLNMEAAERMPSIFSRVLWSGRVAAPLREHRRNASLLKLPQQNHPRQLPYRGFSLSASNFSVAH